MPLFKDKFRNTKGWYKRLQKKTFGSLNFFLTTAINYRHSNKKLKCSGLGILPDNQGPF